MAVISQPHNRSGSFLCHFKEHYIQIYCILLTRPVMVLKSSLHLMNLWNCSIVQDNSKQNETLQAITKQNGLLNHLSQYWIPLLFFSHVILQAASKVLSWLHFALVTIVDTHSSWFKTSQGKGNTCQMFGGKLPCHMTIVGLALVSDTED